MLAVLAALCVGVAAYLTLAALERDEATSDARAGDGPTATGLDGARLIARAVDRDDPGRGGALLVVKGGRRQPAGGELACARVYFAGGRGLCLAAVEGGPGYEATIFDSSLRALRRVPLAGLPSRARVSSDGRHGAATVFVDGHAYEGPAGFSTVTTIFDMYTGAELGNLEEFAVTKDGKPFDAVDFNFWGVSFERANSDRFYATLHTGSHYYLVEGSVWRRAMRVLRDGVECPSLSPDGTRIAFKSRVGGEDRWRLKVLDLDTLKAHPVAERHNFDDQAEWLDTSTLVYSDRFDVYTVPAGGGGSRRLVAHDAASPVALGVRSVERVKPGPDRGSKAQNEG